MIVLLQKCYDYCSVPQDLFVAETSHSIVDLANRWPTQEGTVHVKRPSSKGVFHRAHHYNHDLMTL